MQRAAQMSLISRPNLRRLTLLYVTRSCCFIELFLRVKQLTAERLCNILGCGTSEFRPFYRCIELELEYQNALIANSFVNVNLQTSSFEKLMESCDIFTVLSKCRE
jgi:hypothetical protein